MDKGRFPRPWHTVQKVAAAEGDASICIPLGLGDESLRLPQAEGLNTFSDLRKSLASFKSISLTPGLRTMLPMGRL